MEMAWLVLPKAALACWGEARGLALLDKPRVISMLASTAAILAKALASLAVAAAGRGCRAIALMAPVLLGSAKKVSPGALTGMSRLAIPSGYASTSFFKMAIAPKSSMHPLLQLTPVP